MKQGELEKAIRRARGELRETEKARDKGLEERDAARAEVESLHVQLQARDAAIGNTEQSRAAMEAVSKASSDKLSAVEAELKAARDDAAATKDALHAAWGESKELKRERHALRAKVEHMESTLQNDAESKRVGDEARRESRERESALEAQIAQLQASLTRATQEAGVREDTLRDELADVRARWQDAVARAETIAEEVRESSTPLLHQIKALQEEARARARTWAATESMLTERATTAETAARASDLSLIHI